MVETTGLTAPVSKKAAISANCAPLGWVNIPVPRTPRAAAVSGSISAAVVTSTPRRKSAGSLNRYGLSLVGPLEWLGHGSIVIVDKSKDLGLQVLNRDERPSFEQLAHQNAEPNFILVEPGTMHRSIMENHLMTGIREKGSPAGHRGQNATLAFDAQVLFDARQVRHPADQGLGLMGVQLVTHHMPAGRLGLGGHYGLQMGQEIGFGAGRSTGGSQQVAGDDIAAQDEGARPMSHILKFPPLDFALCQRQAGVLAFERLDTRQLVGTHGHFSLLSSPRRFCIHRADGRDLLVALRLVRRSQPIADQVRLEIVFFNKRAACRGEICLMMPRRMTSSAISRPVHWLMGRSLGCSQAIAITWQICSALIWLLLPGRGTSLSRSCTDRSASAMLWKASQRLRQARTVSTLTSSSRAIWLLFLPASASKMMRALSATCWAVVWPRTNRFNSLRSSSLKLNASGFGPRMTGSPPFPGFRPSILQTYFSLNVLDKSALSQFID